MSFHITGDDVYYEGHLVARLLPMLASYDRGYAAGKQDLDEAARRELGKLATAS